MSPTLENIFLFIENYTGKTKATPNSDIEGELRIYADDWHNMIEKFANEFDIDMTSYLWYFHTGEEGGIGIGSIFSRPPYDRVKRIPITPNDLLRMAQKKCWDIEYPKHKLPTRRYDLIFGTVFLIIILGLVIWFKT